MKKYLFILSTAIVCFFATSCATDGCSFEGNWTVSDVKVESAKLKAPIIKIIEEEYLNTGYQFNADGTMSITASNGTVSTGKYKFDAATNTLRWTDDEFSAESVMTINTCEGGAINLTQRMPSDPAQEESALIVMTIVQGN